MRVYFDTNVLRYLSTAFKDHELPADLKDKIVLSPISSIELLSQLCDDSAVQAYAAVQAMWNWAPERATLLDIPPVFIRLSVAGIDEDGATAFERMTNALTHCLTAKSTEQLRDASKELRNYLQQTKLHDAETRRQAVLRMREMLVREKRSSLTEEELRDAFSHAIAIRARVAPDHPGIAPFIGRIEAFYQHETVRLNRAIAIPKMNLVSRKRQNDLFDSEQLLYLAAPDLRFVTTDRGYEHLAASAQGRRILITKREAMLNHVSAETVIRAAVAEVVE